MPILRDLKNKKILILGFGKYEGPSVYRYLRKHFPKIEVGIADANQPTDLPTDTRIRWHIGTNYLNSLNNYDIVIKTSGISPHKPEILAAQAKGVKFTSLTNIFFELCPGKIIGITGTKGKSTTASLIYHVLKENKFKSILVGNIGKPALDYFDQITSDTLVVHELSSFQLIDLTSSPHIAVLLPIYADHLNYHKNLEEYQNAKLNITRFQTAKDYLICHESQQNIPTRAHKIVFSAKDFDPGLKTQLLGEHNKINIIPSVLIGELLGLTKHQIYSSIATFQPLETRLTNCGTFKGTTFYADTLATIPEATIAAIDTLNPATLIAGGFDRGQDYRELGKRIDRSHIKTLILFPTTGSRIAQAVTSHRIHIYNVGSMQEAVSLAYEHTPSGSTCLLSPGAPSFTLFKHYQDEFDQYKKCILAAKNNKSYT